MLLAVALLGGAAVRAAEPVGPVPLPSLNNIPLGVVGHDGRASYPMSTVDQRLRFLAEHNLRLYRSGGDLVNNLARMDSFVRQAKKHGITLRPMIFPTSEARAYEIAKRYADDIKVWEIGNELDFSRAGAEKRVAEMVETYRGIKRASDELGANLKTTINVMSCNPHDVSEKARCPNDARGSLWFLQMARKAGFNFDFISFHYYPYYRDRGYWMNLYLEQMRGLAQAYDAKILYNEVNCAEIYQGNTDGGRPGDKGCYDSLEQILSMLNSQYRDVVAEINLYELLDEPDHEVPHERHFGLVYDLQRPKPLLELVTRFAR